MMARGIVATGGRSTRLGVDKATILLQGGETIAQRGVRLLREVCDDVVEVGPGFTDARCIREVPVGGGPVAALLAGSDMQTPVVLLACDYPRMTVDVLGRLARHAGDSLVPIIHEQPQFVVAMYGERAMAVLRESFERGDRSFWSLDLDALGARGSGFDPEAFLDIDTPSDLAAFRSQEAER